jgi:hypothetical protein
MTKKPIPFNFVLDYLYPLELTIKSMFSVYVIYINNKIVLGLRDRPNNLESNGIWIATSKEHHESLKSDLPSMVSIPVLGNNETSWQLIAADDENFEELAIKLCELIKKNDPRIGKIPKPKKKKSI